MQAISRVNLPQRASNKGLRALGLTDDGVLVAPLRLRGRDDSGEKLAGNIVLAESRVLLRDELSDGQFFEPVSPWEGPLDRRSLIQEVDRRSRFAEPDVNLSHRPHQACADSRLVRQFTQDPLGTLLQQQADWR